MNSAFENQQLERQFANALAALTRNDVQPWIDLFAEDGGMEFPFAPAGVSPRTEGGKAGVAAHLARFPENFRLFRIKSITFR